MRTKDGAEYKINDWGGLSQVNHKAYFYDESYNNVYNSEAHKKAEKRLMDIRISLVLAYVSKPTSILDFGYGNGSFLNVASEHCDDSKGFDIASTDFHVGKKWKRVDWIDEKNPTQVATFFDSLEHCVNPVEEIKAIGAEYCFVSVPYAHIGVWNNEEFETWHHRKPNEHLHHFNRQALKNMFKDAGYTCLFTGVVEDEVRKGKRDEANILSAVFKKLK